MYNYEREKSFVFTTDGYNTINQIKQNIKNKEQFSMLDAMNGICGDSWSIMACIDFLCENGEFRMISKGEVTQYNTYKKCY